jgi:hypothetical protein
VLATNRERKTPESESKQHCRRESCQKEAVSGTPTGSEDNFQYQFLQSGGFPF